MGKTLVLAEKPSVAKELARVLGCGKGGNGCMEGARYVVTWALGHLVTLADPESYDGRYKSWKLEDLPMLPKKMELVVIKETARQYGIVRSLLGRSDIDELVIATDAGREGELVARWIINKAGFRKPIKRLWISSQTDKAIREGFSNLKPGKDYENLYISAQCRAEADWLVGLNVTRALTCKHNAQLSAGRVQTPTLAMIVHREEEIRKFIPVDYWTVEVKGDGFTVQWRDSVNNQSRIFNKSKADQLIKDVTGKSGKIIEVRKEAHKELPPLAYDLTELQRDANRKYGFTAKKTSNVLQKLYETHKLVTYPRTDSRYISQDIVPTLTERLKSMNVGPYANPVRELLKSRLNITSHFVDNSKVTDHHAIIPTEQYLDLSSLENDERSLYDLIAKRFLAVLSPAYEYEQTIVKVKINDEFFHASGRIEKSRGWKNIYQGHIDDGEENSDEDKQQVLPNVNNGSVFNVVSAKALNGKTKPPARYTEATLLTAMEHPGKFIDDKDLRKVVETVSGLGTPATRADIIEKLFDSFYVERKGKEIHPTSKGIQLIGLVPGDLKSPELTAKWEQKLQLISKGKEKGDSFVNDMKVYASKLVSMVIAGNAAYRHDNLTREKCPECGKYLLDVNGKKGRMMVCQDRDCGYRKGISMVSNARCPECHKKLEIRGEGENKLFSCACGYREKLSDFNKRKSQQVNKREITNFLKGQSNEGPINSALADALAKWKK